MSVVRSRCLPDSSRAAGRAAEPLGRAGRGDAGGRARDGRQGRLDLRRRHRDVAEIDDLERLQRVGIAQRRIERPHQPRLLTDRRRSLAAADPRRMRAAIERQAEHRRLAPLHRRRGRHAHEGARRPQSLDLAQRRRPLVASRETTTSVANLLHCGRWGAEFGEKAAKR